MLPPWTQNQPTGKKYSTACFASRWEQDQGCFLDAQVESVLTVISIVNTGVQGLCLGILLGAAATDASFHFLMWRTDWSLEADKAAERVGVKTLSGSADVSLGSIASLPMQETTDSSEQQFAEAETARLLAGHLPMSQHQHQEHV